jgi:CspA family cold shock protein
MNTTTTSTTPATPTEIIMSDETTYGNTLGYCKWFSNSLGFGFITVRNGEHKGKDIFVHHTGIEPVNSNFKTLTKGEYVNFNIILGAKGLQAVSITGVEGGPLICDNVHISAPIPRAQQARPYQQQNWQDRDRTLTNYTSAKGKYNNQKDNTRPPAASGTDPASFLKRDGN